MMEEPKDIGIKMNTKTGAKWEEVLRTQEEALVANELNAEIAKGIIKLAVKRIEQEKAKL